MGDYCYLLLFAWLFIFFIRFLTPQFKDKNTNIHKIQNNFSFLWSNALYLPSVISLCVLLFFIFLKTNFSTQLNWFASNQMPWLGTKEDQFFKFLESNSTVQKQITKGTLKIREIIVMHLLHASFLRSGFTVTLITSFNISQSIFQWKKCIACLRVDVKLHN